MLKVFFTVDVEIWCDGWQNIDAKFPDAYQRYIYGRTATGDYGLPFQLQQLQEHGLLGVFFVEPLFAARFGLDPLVEIIALLHTYKQEVQLHLHTEWVDEAKTPLLANVQSKRQHLRYFSLAEQEILIAAGKKLIHQAHGGEVNAFRAGSFAFNKNTLTALATHGIKFDSSYNAASMGLDSGVMPGTPVVEPIKDQGVYEYPMTVFNDGTRALRPAQLTSCSYQEMEALLWQALEAQRTAFVMLSHNFELLNPRKNRPDPVVIKRFLKLCRFLDKNRDCFKACGFQDLEAVTAATQPPPLKSSRWKTGIRMAEQLMRHRYS